MLIQMQFWGAKCNFNKTIFKFKKKKFKEKKKKAAFFYSPVIQYGLLNQLEGLVYSLLENKLQV